MACALETQIDEEDTVIVSTHLTDRNPTQHSCTSFHDVDEHLVSKLEDHLSKDPKTACTQVSPSLPISSSSKDL